MSEPYTSYGPHVRVVCKPVDGKFCDLVVLRRDGSKWAEVSRHNDSNPTALDDAYKSAINARRQILEGEYK